MKKLELKNVKAMLPEWEKTNKAIGAALVAARNDAEFEEWKYQRHMHDEALREAFYEDTKDRNSRDNCMIAPTSWIIRMAKEG